MAGKNGRVFIACLCALTWALSPASGTGEELRAPKEYVCVRLPQEPILDGRVDGDAAWQHMPVGRGYRDLRSRRPSAKQTAFRLGYTAEGLFIGIACGEPNRDSIQGDMADGAESDGLLSCRVAQADPKEHVEIRAAFSAGTRTIEGRFRFTDVGDVQILPARTMAGVAIQAPISVGVLPGMKLEAVLYRPDDYPEPNEILVPCENWLAGLLKGNNGIAQIGDFSASFSTLGQTLGVNGWR